MVRDEDSVGAWEKLFARAQAAGLNLQKLRGICSDGAQGLLTYLRRELVWVLQQHCVCHIWRSLSGEIAPAVSQAAQGLADATVAAVRIHVRAELVALIRGVVNAQHAEAAETALVQLLAHPHGKALSKQLMNLMDRLFVCQLDYCRGLQWVSPEWYWSDFHLRLSRGRNHRSE